MRNKVLALGALPLSIGFGSTAAWAAPAWTVSESSGPVSIASPGFTRVAQRGGSLAIGDVVSTGRGGRVVLVRGEEYLVVAPNTRLTVADPTPSGGLTQFVEQVGNVIYRIRKMATPHFAVQTPYLAAVVKGTTFSVTVTDKGASVQVIEGRVEVATRDGGAAFLVLPGDIGSVSAARPGQLRVEGRESRTIDSPKAATTAATVASPGDLLRAAADATPDPQIAAAIVEPSVTLAALTNGMVRGDSAMLVPAVVKDTPRPAEVPSTGFVAAPPPQADLPPSPAIVADIPSVSSVAATPAPSTPILVPATPNPAAPVVVAAAPVVVAAPPPLVLTPPPAAATPLPTAAPQPPASPVVVVAALAPAPIVPAPVVIALATPAVLVAPSAPPVMLPATPAPAVVTVSNLPAAPTVGLPSVSNLPAVILLSGNGNNGSLAGVSGNGGSNMGGSDVDDKSDGGNQGGSDDGGKKLKKPKKDK